MARHGVPTARFVIADEEGHALEVARAGTLGWPLVVKADGLAAGKGVVLADTAAEAESAIRDMMSGARFGQAGARVVLEECLSGPEVSFFVLTDGLAAMPLGTAQDHKRAHDGDTGPNTGGMGAFSPSPLVDAPLHGRILAEIVEPVLRGMREDGHPYRGFLYCGLMLTGRGPMVIEFNARLGDPETQVLLPLDEPLLPLLQAVASRQLPSRPARIAVASPRGRRHCLRRCPDAFQTGKPITGLDTAAALDDVRVFHAGTKLADGHVVNAGGRVLTVVGEGDTFQLAMQRAYAGVDCIKFEGASAQARHRRPRTWHRSTWHLAPWHFGTQHLGTSSEVLNPDLRLPREPGRFDGHRARPPRARRRRRAVGRRGRDRRQQLLGDGDGRSGHAPGDPSRRARQPARPDRRHRLLRHAVPRRGRGASRRRRRRAERGEGNPGIVAHVPVLGHSPPGDCPQPSGGDSPQF